jgi:ubiquinone/menaquinone biosynthesis C-methylase UbiE
VTAELFSAGFAKVRGYDASQKMIARAKTQHPLLRFTVADAAKLPDADHSVDAVVVSALFTSIPERARQTAVVEEIQRVLRPGGSVHGVEFLRQTDASNGAFTSRTGIAMWHFQPEELRELFAAFTGWISWRQNVSSLYGTPSSVLQFVAYAA